MKLSELLEIRSGVTAVIGSGGKTTLLRCLGESLAQSGNKVVLCTTTHIWPFAHIPLCTSDDERVLSDLLSGESLVTVGMVQADTGKLSKSGIPMARLARLSDYVLVEADGSRQLPLKAHAPWEPVIPPEAGQTICVVGLSGLGRPLSEAVHRPDIFRRLSGAVGSVTVEALAAVLNRESLPDRYFLNQADTEEDIQLGRRLSELLQRPTVIGSLHSGQYERA